MKKLWRSVLFIATALLLLLISFYFWASAPKFNENTYQKVIVNQYPQDLDRDSVFSIVTYNIGYLSGMNNNLPVKIPKSLVKKNLDLVIDHFTKINADILAFQEIDYAAKRSYDINQQDEIAKIGYNYVAQAVNWDKNYLPFPEFPVHLQYGRILSGQSILSKFKIKDHKRITLDRNKTNPFYYDAFYIDRLAQIAFIEILNQTIVIINVHLEAFHQDTRRIQTQKILDLFNQYKASYPTILLGDFNSDKDFKNATIKAILDLENIGNAVYSKRGYPKTFNSKTPTERLDYIFYNTNFIEFIDGRRLDELGTTSDHLPLIMQFKLK